MLYTMAKPLILSLSLCLLLFASACLASLDSPNKCQLDKLHVLEPDHRVKAQAGVIETWSPSKHPELDCAGFAVSRRTLDPNGLHLPSYSPYSQLIMVVQGEGALGEIFPGCPDTFEEAQSRSKGGKYRFQKLQDSHQKIRHFQKGDIILVPRGIPYWTYNYGKEQIVAISLLDTSSLQNQLDPIPRVFYIGGNPEVEHPETLEQQQQQQNRKSHGGAKQGRSVLSGFSKHFIAQSLNVNEDIAEQLQSPDDERKQMVKVEGGLSVISPKWKPQEEEDEREREDEPGSEKKREHEEEEATEEEDEPKRHKTKKHTEWRETSPQHREEGEEEKTEEWEEKPGRNGFEEALCTLKIHENIAKPERADFYNPRAGRISTLNSLTLPSLRHFGLSAQYVVLYSKGIYAPHWNQNSNSLLYVTRGNGRVIVVNCQGEPVFDGELKRGQMLMVPQNFVVAEQAGEEGFEYVVFKTHHQAVTSYMKEVFRAIPAEVLVNGWGLRPQQVSELKFNGNWGPLVNPEPRQSSRVA